MGITMKEARLRLRLSQEELAAVTSINQALISQIETGVRKTTLNQRLRICQALGAVTLFQEEIDMSVPTVPIAKWREDGTPDFTHLEGGDTVQEQLQTLISRKNGRVVRIDTDHFYFEVEGKVHEQRYVVENGKAALDGNSKEAGPEFEVLSRRRIGKAGVPPMPTTDQE